MQGGHGDQVEHEIVVVPCRREENAQWARFNSIRVVPNSRRRLTLSWGGTIQFCNPDLEGLLRVNIMGPLNKRSLTDVHHQEKEWATTIRKEKFLVENKPNNKHYKMYRQLAKPLGQSGGEYSSDYHRVSSVKGDEKIYAHLDSPKGAACLRPMTLWN